MIARFHRADTKHSIINNVYVILRKKKRRPIPYLINIIAICDASTRNHIEEEGKKRIIDTFMSLKSLAQLSLNNVFV